MREKNRGITLIALIITIIVMLILVTVSINIAINSGLFQLAGKGAKDTKNTIITEQELAGGMINVDGKIYASMEDYVAGEETITDLKNLVIGAPINYHEYIGEGGNALSTMPSYKSPKEKTGHSEDQEFTVTNNSRIEWIVLGEENGQIKITTKNVIQPTSGGYETGDFNYYRCGGKTGYANIVEELHKIGSIYGKVRYADTSKYSININGTEESTGGRSFTMEDLGYGACTRKEGYTYALEQHEGDTEAKVYRYAAGTEPDGTSTTGGTYTKFVYMNLDTNPDKIEAREDADKTWKELSSSNPYVTICKYTYEGSKTLSTNVSKADTNYFIASRAIYLTDGSSYCRARTAFSYEDETSANCLVLSANYFYNIDAGFRPVVYLKSDIQLSYNSEMGLYTIK